MITILSTQTRRCPEKQQQQAATPVSSLARNNNEGFQLQQQQLAFSTKRYNVEPQRERNVLINYQHHPNYQDHSPAVQQQSGHFFAAATGDQQQQHINSTKFSVKKYTLSFTHQNSSNNRNFASDQAKNKQQQQREPLPAAASTTGQQQARKQLATPIKQQPSQDYMIAHKQQLPATLVGGGVGDILVEEQNQQASINCGHQQQQIGGSNINQNHHLHDGQHPANNMIPVQQQTSAPYYNGAGDAYDYQEPQQPAGPMIRGNQQATSYNVQAGQQYAQHEHQVPPPRQQFPPTPQQHSAQPAPSLPFNQQQVSPVVHQNQARAPPQMMRPQQQPPVAQAQQQQRVPPYQQQHLQHQMLPQQLPVRPAPQVASGSGIGSHNIQQVNGRQQQQHQPTVSTQYKQQQMGPQPGQFYQQKGNPYQSQASHPSSQPGGNSLAPNTSAFIDQDGHRYPSNSPPILLHQQINQGQRMASSPQRPINSYQQQPPAGRRLPSAFEEELLGEPVQYEPMRAGPAPAPIMRANANGPLNPTGYVHVPASQSTYVGVPGPQPQKYHKVLGVGQQQQASGPQVIEQHPSASSSLPHLLGNPTPPLTPNAVGHTTAGNRSVAQWQAQPGDHVLPSQAGNYPKHVGPHNHHRQVGHSMPQQQQLMEANGPPMQSIQRSMPKNMHQNNFQSNQFDGPNNSNSHQQQHPPQQQNPIPSEPHHLQQQLPPVGPIQGPPTVDHSSGQMVSGPMRGQQQFEPTLQQSPQQITQPNQHRQAPVMQAPQPTRLTLPLRDAPILGPFRLEHGIDFHSKVFLVNSVLFDTLSKSMNAMVNQHSAAVIQELQFRAYLIDPSTGGSHQQADSLLSPDASAPKRCCDWPNHGFQVSINQHPLHLDRISRPNKACDIIQYCRPGENIIEIQGTGCYCGHEFVIEPVDRPTVKAFVSSCFKSRLVSADACVQKLKQNFGSQGFLIQHFHNKSQNVIIHNEYITTSEVNGFDQHTQPITRARISIKCPISGRRMRTPARGHNCKHLQCFDLESFVFANREQSRWTCPVCPSPIAFNMLVLDQHQINIAQSLGPSNSDEILVDSNGQWQAYYPPASHQAGPPGHMQSRVQPQTQPSHPPVHGPPSLMINANHQHHQPHQTAKSTGTFHPQAPSHQIINSGLPTQMIHHTTQHFNIHGGHLPARPVGGSPANVARPMPTQAGSPAVPVWDNQDQLGSSPSGASGPIRRPASAISHQAQAANGTGRRSANGSPQAKKHYSGSYGQQQNFGSPAPTGYSEHQQIVGPPASVTHNDGSDDLSPLAAMERAVIQQQQEMGPPPFDPSNLVPSPVAPTRAASNSSPAINSNSTLASNQQCNMSTHQQQVIPAASQMMQPSPEARAPITGAFSPAVSSPAAAARLVPASPQQHHQQSPMQQQPPIQTSNSSMPATPSSSILIHGGPETPATPSNSSGQQAQICNSQGANINLVTVANGGANGAQQTSGVDHQPLSNGSASAGSITSTSTMTPSGQSLGSVGMGGDSRCGTAPLQVSGNGSGNNSLNLDDLMVHGAVTPHHGYKHSSGFSGAAGGTGSSQMELGEKNEILMGKLMMNSSESLLRDHRNGELALALEEAEWKQQLDRGKSEHLANFLNEPLMKRHQQHHYQQQQQRHNPQHARHPNGETMLSGGLNPSDDEEATANARSHASSPSHNLDQLTDFSNYLDADDADNGAGLPPDDSILDLFER